MFVLLLAATQTLEGGPRLVVETVRYPRGTLLGMLDRLHVAEEGLGGQRLHLATGGRANGRVRGDDADSLARSVLCCKPLDQRIRVLRKTHLERTAHLVLADPVEDEHAAGAAQGDEARKRVPQLARVGKPARMEQVVSVEEVQGGISHLWWQPLSGPCVETVTGMSVRDGRAGSPPRRTPREAATAW